MQYNLELGMIPKRAAVYKNFALHNSGQTPQVNGNAEAYPLEFVGTISTMERCCDKWVLVLFVSWMHARTHMHKLEHAGDTLHIPATSITLFH